MHCSSQELNVSFIDKLIAMKQPENNCNDFKKCFSFFLNFEMKEQYWVKSHTSGLEKENAFYKILEN